MWKHMSDAAKRKEKQKWAIQKPKLDNARRLRGIYFIDPDDEEFKCMMKNARRKLEIPMPAAMRLVDFNVVRPGKPVVQLENTTQYTLVLLKPTNLWGYAWKDLITRIMQITLQEKAWIHWVTTILCTNLFLCVKQWKYQMQRQQWRKNVKKLEKKNGMTADESQKQKWGDRWSKERKQNSTFCVVHGHLPSWEFGVGATVSEI